MWLENHDISHQIIPIDPIWITIFRWDRLQKQTMKPRNSRGWASATSRRHFLALSDFLCIFIATPTKDRKATSYIILLKSWMTVLSSGVLYGMQLKKRNMMIQQRILGYKICSNKAQTSTLKHVSQGRANWSSSSEKTGQNWLRNSLMQLGLSKNRVFKKRRCLKFKTLILEFQMDTKHTKKNISR